MHKFGLTMLAACGITLAGCSGAPGEADYAEEVPDEEQESLGQLRQAFTSCTANQPITLRTQTTIDGGSFEAAPVTIGRLEIDLQGVCKGYEGKVIASRLGPEGFLTVELESHPPFIGTGRQVHSVSVQGMRFGGREPIPDCSTATSSRPLLGIRPAPPVRGRCRGMDGIRVSIRHAPSFI